MPEALLQSLGSLQVALAFPSYSQGPQGKRKESVCVPPAFLEHQTVILPTQPSRAPGKCEIFEAPSGLLISHIFPVVLTELLFAPIMLVL